jgi:dTDP-4-dehydrorhamnose reductase
VYSGLEEEGPYTEDLAKPGNVYAAHKLEMEQRVMDIAPDAVMLRAEWMYDYYLKKKAEGKKDKQAIVAGMNKFFRIYYARSMEAYRSE